MRGDGAIAPLFDCMYNMPTFFSWCDYINAFKQKKYIVLYNIAF